MGGMGPMGGLAFDMGPMGPMGMGPMQFGGMGGPMPGPLMDRRGPGMMPGGMLGQPDLMMKRRRMMDAEAGMLGGPGHGSGGIRGAPGGMAGMDGRRPQHGGGRTGFLGRGQHGYRNGGAIPTPNPQIMASITEAITPHTILKLWAGESHLWVEGHLGQGLLQFAKLVEETCPEDMLEVHHPLRCRLLSIVSCVIVCVTMPGYSLICIMNMSTCQC
jgi:hypothetical protein